MVRTDNFATFYRHDKNGNGKYMSNTKTSNYFNSVHQQNQQLMNASLSPGAYGVNRTQRPRPPPGLPPPPSASLPRQNYNSNAKYTPADNYYETKQQQSNHYNNNIESPNRQRRIAAYSDFNTPVPSPIHNRFGQQPSQYYQQLTYRPPPSSSGGGWKQQNHNTINYMNLSPRGENSQYYNSNMARSFGTPSKQYPGDYLNITQHHNNTKESPYKPNIKRKWRKNRTAGKKTGILYDNLTTSAVSSQGPTWWHANSMVPVNNINKKSKSMQTGMDMTKFDGAAGMKSGAILDDTAESSDAPDWMMQLPGIPRPPPPKKALGHRTEFGHYFKGAAGRSTGVVLDDTAESGDAPRWMRMIPGVERSKDPRKAVAGRDFSLEFAKGDRFGKPTNAVLDDSAVSGDAPDFFHIQGVPKSRVVKVPKGHKTDFSKDNTKTAAGRYLGASKDDSAISDDVPDFMCIPGVPRVKGPVRKSGHKTGDNRDFENAAGMPRGTCPDDSAVSSLAPSWFHIKGVPKTKLDHQRGINDGYQNQGTFGGYANKNLKINDFSDTAISQNSPQFMHIPGIQIFNERKKATLGMKSVDFKNGHHPGGDSTISTSAPDWMRSNPYVPLANDHYSDFGQSKHTFMGGEIGKGLKSDLRVFKQPSHMVPKVNRNNPKEIPVEKSKPKKFPLGLSNRIHNNNINPDSMKGGVSHALADADMLPISMQSAVMYGNPEFIRQSKHFDPRIKNLSKTLKDMGNLEMPPGILMYTGKKRNESFRPKTKMKGSVSFAKRDLDNLPMRNWVGSNKLSPMVRQETKSRVISRGVNVSELAGGRKQQQMAFTKELKRNEIGGGQHHSFISKGQPTWLSCGPKTAHKQKRSGIGEIANGPKDSGISRDAPTFMRSNPYVPINANLSSKERNARLLNRTAQSAR